MDEEAISVVGPWICACLRSVLEGPLCLVIWGGVFERYPRADVESGGPSTVRDKPPLARISGKTDFEPCCFVVSLVQLRLSRLGLPRPSLSPCLVLLDGHGHPSHVGLPTGARIVVPLHPGTNALTRALPGGLTTDGQLDMMMITRLAIRTGMVGGRGRRRGNGGETGIGSGTEKGIGIETEIGGRRGEETVMRMTDGATNGTDLTVIATHKHVVIDRLPLERMFALVHPRRNPCHGQSHQFSSREHPRTARPDLKPKRRSSG